MRYTKEFKERCKKVIGHWDKLEEHLEMGSEFVGRVLDDSRHVTMKDIKNIHNLLIAGDASSAIQICERYIEVDKLYSEWLKRFRAKSAHATLDL